MSNTFDANLVRRIAVAAVGIPLALALVWYGSWPLAALVALIAALGTGELYDLAERIEVRPFRAVGIAAAAAVPMLTYASHTDSPVALLWLAGRPYFVAAFVLLLLAMAVASRSSAARPLASVAVTLFGVYYAAVLPAFILLIRLPHWPNRSWAGAMLVFFPLVVTWVCDTAAMFGGRAFGGPKLAPSISPGKTRSGAIAGLIGAVAIAPLFALVIFPPLGVQIGVLAACAMALVLSVVGQLGDLVESLFKREAGVKDSSSLIPGHGGVLDRFDSLYFVLPAAAACYRLLGLA